MKTTIKFLGVITLALVTVFTMISCSEDEETKTDAVSPFITVSPINAVYLPGATVTPLSVTANVSDGGTLSYQWYSETTIYSYNPTAVASATNATFTPPTTTAGTLYYYAEVTNTNSGVNGTKTAVQTSGRAKFVVGWESVDVSDIENGTLYMFSPKSIIFANNLFVAVGGSNTSGGQIGWSNDGIKWKVIQSNPFGTSVINSIAYGNNKFIAVGNGGKMASSTDGKTWASVDASAAFGTSNINDIAYGNGKFFAVGDATKSAYLADNSSTWTLADTSTSNTIFGSNASISCIVYGANCFSAYSGSQYNSIAECPYFSNSETTIWQGVTVQNSEHTAKISTISDLVSAGSYTVAVGDGGNVLKYANGGDNYWTNISPSSLLGTNNISKAAYGSGKLLVFSSDKGAWSGDNGTTWTEVPYIDMTRMAYGAGLFVAVAGGSGIKYSKYP